MRGSRRCWTVEKVTRMARYKIVCHPENLLAAYPISLRFPGAAIEADENCERGKVYVIDADVLHHEPTAEGWEEFGDPSITD